MARIHNRQAPQKKLPARDSGREFGSALRLHLGRILALWVAILVAYSNSFQAGLIMDSSVIVLQDSRVREVSSRNLNLILSEEYWHNTTETGLYRPFTTLSYLVNFAVLGNGQEPAGYHWVNLFLHAVNVALVYLLGLLLLGEGWRAMSMAALWGLHPVLTESVTNVVGRADLLAAFGVLSGFLCYVQSMTSDGRRRAVWLAGSSIASTIGLFSKESAVVIVAVMLLYDYTAGRQSPWRARLPAYAAVLAPFPVFFYLRARMLAHSHAVIGDVIANPLWGAGFLTARLTAVKVIGKLLWLFVWPLHLSCDYSYNQIPLFTWRWNNWEDGKTWISMAVCLAAVGIAAVCIRRRKTVTFLICFFFAALAPTSNLVVVIGTIMGERFLYLPSVALAGILTLGIFAAGERLPARWNPKHRAPWAVVGVICLAYVARAHARNSDWLDEESLWSSALSVSAGNAKVHFTLAGMWSGADSSRLDGAIGEIGRCLEILNRLPEENAAERPYWMAGLIYRQKGDRLAAAGLPAAAQTWYQKALEALLRGARIDRLEQDRALAANLAEGKGRVFTGWAPLYLEQGRVWLRLGTAQSARAPCLRPHHRSSRGLLPGDGQLLARARRSSPGDHRPVGRPGDGSRRHELNCRSGTALPADRCGRMLGPGRRSSRHQSWMPDRTRPSLHRVAQRRDGLSQRGPPGECPRDP